MVGAGLKCQKAKYQNTKKNIFYFTFLPQAENGPIYPSGLGKGPQNAQGERIVRK